MAAYPSSLPKPNSEGYKISHGSSLAETDMEQGPPRFRRRSSSPSDIIPVSFDFTTTEYNTFRNWIHADILDGASWFDITLLTSAGDILCQAHFRPSGATLYDAVYIDENQWRISCTLIIRNPSYA